MTDRIVVIRLIRYIYIAFNDLLAIQNYRYVYTKN